MKPPLKVAPAVLFAHGTAAAPCSFDLVVAHLAFVRASGSGEGVAAGARAHHHSQQPMTAARPPGRAAGRIQDTLRGVRFAGAPPCGPGRHRPGDGPRADGISLDVARSGHGRSPQNEEN